LYVSARGRNIWIRNSKFPCRISDVWLTRLQPPGSNIDRCGHLPEQCRPNFFKNILIPFFSKFGPRSFCKLAVSSATTLLVLTSAFATSNSIKLLYVLWLKSLFLGLNQTHISILFKDNMLKFKLEGAFWEHLYNI